MKIGAFLLRASFLSFALLSACSVMDNPVLKTMSHAVPSLGREENPGLNPHFRYLRVVVEGRVVYLALGNIDHGVKVWYSAMHEVLRLQNGRIAGVTGTATEWRNVSIPDLPSWDTLAGSKKPYKWTRVRDVMPGYQYGIRDELVLHAIPAPKNSELKGWDPGSLAWFEEDDVSRALPPARYAVDLSEGKAVYGETCLSPDLCFSWQYWPVGKKGRG